MAKRIPMIDRLPPAATGNPQKDAAAALEYDAYLVEQLNYIITQIAKEEQANG